VKAVVYRKYGPPDLLRLEDIEKPLPGNNQVLVKVIAASVNAYDWHLLRGKPFMARFFGGLIRPKNPVLGADFAGRVEAVGGSVRQFEPGQEVFGCQQGSFAQYISVREERLVCMPANISFEQAAATPMAALTALQALRDYGSIQPGQRVLINGAGGGVGTFAVQIARSFGAEVTGVCSTRNLEMVRSIGAHHVIDYNHENFTKSDRSYDLIIGANGYHSIFDYRRALSPRGVYIMTGGSNAQMFQASLGGLVSVGTRKKLGGMMAKVDPKDLAFLAKLLEEGRIKPVIDRHYPLGEVPQAIRYIEEGHARGKIIIVVEDERA